MEAIPFNTLKPQYEKYGNEYLAAAKRVLESGRYILGEELEAFEKEFADYIGSKYCVGLASGLDALTLALMALDIKVGDEVIVPANTYIATVLAVTNLGATPIFVEPDEYFGIDVDRIEDAITAKTKAILPVHLYGQACAMDRVMEIAKRHNLYVVEDCAQSHGVAYKDKKTGTFGIIGCFSFFPTKNLGAFGDAGGIVTDDETIARKIKILRNYGSEKKYINDVSGVNSRLDELQAALLRVKLRHLDELTKERQKIAYYYLENMKSETITFPQQRADSTHCWHLFVIRHQKRDLWQKKLDQHGISTQIHYPIPPHLAKAYNHLGYKKGDFPKAEEYAGTILSLPLYNGMPFDSYKKVVDVIGGV